jgi:hypothetical protein
MWRCVVWSITTNISEDTVEIQAVVFHNILLHGTLKMCYEVIHILRVKQIFLKKCRKQLNISERKVYRRILGLVYDNEKENCRTLTNKEIYAIVKNPTITDTLRLHTLRWFRHVLRMEENRIPKKVLYVNLETTRPRGVDQGIDG